MGFLFGFVNSKNPISYQISEYYGMIFFQPEIYGRRNISSKILSFMMCFVSLIFFSFYFVSLEEALSDLQTFGGATIEDGLYKQKIWVEDLWYNTNLYSLATPIQVGSFWFGIEDWQNFIEENPGGIYIVLSVFADIIVRAERNCHLKILGDFFWIDDGIPWTVHF